MEDIIKDLISQIFDKLLEKALETEPDFVYKDIACVYYSFSLLIEKNMRTGNYELSTKYEKNVINWTDLTISQNEMIKRIFEKWNIRNEIIIEDKL